MNRIVKLDLEEIDNILESDVDDVKHTSALAITFHHLDNSKFETSRKLEDGIKEEPEIENEDEDLSGTNKGNINLGK